MLARAIRDPKANGDFDGFGKMLAWPLPREPQRPRQVVALLPGKGEWQHDYFYMKENYRPQIFDNFEGKLQTSKWAKIVKTSTDTALRDIKDLVEKGILKQTDEGGRNANYELVDFRLE